MILDALYFGCWDRAGHFLWTPAGVYLSSIAERELPLALRSETLDGGYAPMGPEEEGRALVHLVHGRTVLAFWDRSVDARGRCSSAFILKGHLSFDEAVAAARAAFPTIWARFKFEVVPWEAPG